MNDRFFNRMANLNLASSASLPTGAFSYTWLSDGTKVSARADDGFGARMYDPFTARWTAVDPMAAKYPSHSPFNYCEGSPINRIDPQGDTIVVLYARSGAYGAGHMAILIQDEKGAYHLYSKNGDKFKGPKYADNEGDPIDDIQSFLDGIHNAPGKTMSKGKPYYTQGYMIATTPEQDAKIRETMQGEVDNKYNFFFNNCGQAVMNSLEAADVPTSTFILEALPKIYSGSAIGAIEHSFNEALPARIYFNIKRANPRGTVFKPTKNKKSR